MAVPVIVGLLFADRIITEVNGKKGIIGVFNRFMAKKFPVSFPPWAIYAAVTNVTGEHDFELRLSDNESTQQVFAVSGSFKARSMRDVIELIPTIHGAVFEKPGTYYLAISVDGVPVGGRILNVSKASSDGETGKS